MLLKNKNRKKGWNEVEWCLICILLDTNIRGSILKVSVPVLKTCQFWTLSQIVSKKKIKLPFFSWGLQSHMTKQQRNIPINVSLGDIVHCEYITEYTYTNLENTAYCTPSLYGIADCFQTTNLYNMLLY